MKKNKVLGAIVVLSFASSGCAFMPFGQSITPLAEYVKEYGFTEFTPPRSNDGIGTIIKFDEEHRESIVSGRERCFPASQVPSLSEVDKAVALISGKYKITKSNDLELGISKVLTQSALGVPLDLASAFKNSRVESIEIQFIDPFRDRITSIDTKDYVRSLMADDSCLEEINRDSNLIIHTVLGAKGLKYKFIGEGEKALEITADIANAIGAGDEFQTEWGGELGFEIDQNILIGYRAWKASSASGAFVSDITLTELSAPQIRTMKK